MSQVAPRARSSGRRLRVGLVAYGLDRPLSGVTRVALELGRALIERDDCDLTVLAPYRDGPFVGEAGVRTVFLRGGARLPGLMALGGPVIARIAGRLELDVVHDPVGVGPFTLGRSIAPFGRVLTIHDAIAFEYPAGYPLLNNVLHRHFVPAVLPNVDAVVTVSQDARTRLARYLAIPPPPIDVVPNAIAPHFQPVAPTTASEIAARYGLTGRYVLYVGVFKRHKNLVRLADAFARLADAFPRHTLALVGPAQWAFPELAERLSQADLLGRVRVLGVVAEPDLPGLYSGADAVALPSLHEGFGLPALEAMACGAPVVCSRTGSLPEVVGDVGVLVDPTSVESIAAGIRQAIADTTGADRRRTAGIARARTYTWARTAAGYLAVYRAVASG